MELCNFCKTSDVFITLRGKKLKYCKRCNNRIRNIYCIEHYINNFKLSKEDAIIIISNLQKINNKKYINKVKENKKEYRPNYVDFYLKHGFSLKESINLLEKYKNNKSSKHSKYAKENNTKKTLYRTLNDFIKKYGIKLGTKKYKDRCYKCGKSKRIDYWLNKGYPEKEAKQKLKECQSTFSLEKCIKKHGEVEGRRIFKERQTNWQKTLNDKPLEELERINKLRAKGAANCQKINYSKSELELLTNLELDKAKNWQIILKGNKQYIYDIVIDNKIIEFNGDYWHCNPVKYQKNFFNKSTKQTAENKWKEDSDKVQYAIDKGYNVLVIWESDYNNNKKSVIEKCKKFLRGTND